MISGWLLKVLLGIFLVGAAVLELGSPLITRAQADDAAHEVADDASFAIRGSFTAQSLKDACNQTAADKHVTVVRCDYEESNGDVIVTVEKKARSIILAKWSVTKDWYDIKVTAVSTPKK